MKDLNDEIENEKNSGLNRNYQIGPAYFLKLKDCEEDDLWNDYLEPLLGEYLKGIEEKDDILKKLKEAYGITNSSDDQ